MSKFVIKSEILSRFSKLSTIRLEIKNNSKNERVGGKVKKAGEKRTNKEKITNAIKGVD